MTKTKSEIKERGLSSPRNEIGGLESPPSKVVDPTSPAEWQTAVDLAQFHLLLDAARLYGLLTGAPEVNVERCEELLKSGRKLGYRPRRFP